MKTKIIQWNINGFSNKLKELQFLIKEHHPQIVCIQEINFNEKSNPFLWHCDDYKWNRLTRAKSSGKIAIWLMKISLSKKFHYILNENNHNFSKFSSLKYSYVSVQKVLTLQNIEQIIQQFHIIIILFEDFKSHCKTWGSYE